MKLNTPKSIEAAAGVFRTYGGSWTTARQAGHRASDGVLVIPTKPKEADDRGRNADATSKGERKPG